MTINMPHGARYIIEQLNNNGYEAFIVGGCVRDSMLGKNPNDWDITTSAKPAQVKQIFDRTVDTGIEHGTVTVLVPKDISQGGEYAFEVTTYRIDGVYEDHRRPSEVTFSNNLEEDLKRRDFTINAMAYNDDAGLVDIFGGKYDLDNHIIRCVGNPIERFDEDALRVLRAVRFAGQLGFEIDEATQNAMREKAKFLKEISAERIQVELTKLITSKHPDLLVCAYELGITSYILPEFDMMMNTEQNNINHLYNVGIHTIKVLENLPANAILRYAGLLHDVAKPVCKTTDEANIDHFYGHNVKGEELANVILRRLKLDNNTINTVKKLVLYHDYGFGFSKVSEKNFRRFLAKLGVEYFDDFIAVKKADIAAQSTYNIEEKKSDIELMQAMYQKIIDEKQCLSIKDLALDGKMLIEMGMKPGKQMGETLKLLLEYVMDNPELNTEEELKKIVNNHFTFQ